MSEKVGIYFYAFAMMFCASIINGAPSLPTIDKLLNAKINALQKEQQAQELLLKSVEQELNTAQLLVDNTFNSKAYLLLKIKNSAPIKEYRLLESSIYIDGKKIAQGGKRNQGLPRNSEVYSGIITPGCHNLMVKAKYVRLKNNIINKFKVSRVENITKNMTFIAKDEHTIEIEIEGFEQQNNFLSFYRGPSVRFNKQAKANVLHTDPISSLDGILGQGRVHISYSEGDTSTRILTKKSISIDGLPVMNNKPHEQNKNMLFNMPLTAGSHRINISLFFTERRLVNGGPHYNMRLNFYRDFNVIQGKTTYLNLTGIPRGEFSVAAKAESTIDEEESPFFPMMTCKEIKE